MAAVPRFTRAELESHYGESVPDLLPAASQPLRLLFVGINPGLWTAATQTHFAHPVNRFYPALYAAGIIPGPIDPAAGMTEADRSMLRERGIGISNLVHRATARASELTPAELRAGADTLTALVERRRPAVVAIAGITAYRTAFGVPRAVSGQQAARLGSGPDRPGAELWVVPNPSGLNAHETVATLAAAYAGAARAAGVLPPAA